MSRGLCEVVDPPPEATGAATIEDVAGRPDVKRVVLTEQAKERLGIEVAEVRGDPTAADAHATILPYSALLYDASGATWTYTNPENLTFVRAAVTVTHIDGDDVLLSAGPAPGTRVVTVGAAELLGAEYGVGED